AMPRAHQLQPSSARVGHLDLRSARRVTGVARADDRAVEAQARGPGLVEPRVVDTRRHHLIATAARTSARNQPPNQEPGQRRVTVREVHERRARARARVEAHARAGRRSEIHSREAWQAEAPGVERRDRVDAEAVERMWTRLEERQDVGMAAGAL